jgi:hypothetical protein
LKKYNCLAKDMPSPKVQNIELARSEEKVEGKSLSNIQKGLNKTK